MWITTLFDFIWKHRLTVIRKNPIAGIGICKTGNAKTTRTFNLTFLEVHAHRGVQIMSHIGKKKNNVLDDVYVYSGL